MPSIQAGESSRDVPGPIRESRTLLHTCPSPITVTNRSKQVARRKSGPFTCASSDGQHKPRKLPTHQVAMIPHPMLSSVGERVAKTGG